MLILRKDTTVDEDPNIDTSNCSSTPPPTPAPHYVSETAFFSALPPPPTATASPPPSISENKTPTARRTTRIRFPTWKVRESLPDPITFPPNPPQPTKPHPTRRVFLLVRENISSIKNKFGLSRIYRGLKSRVPDTTINPASMCGPAPSPSASPSPRTVEEVISPYPNLSSFLFDHQFWTSAGKKSRADRDQLSKLMAHPNFKQEDIVGVNL